MNCLWLRAYFILDNPTVKPLTNNIHVKKDYIDYIKVHINALFCMHFFFIDSKRKNLLDKGLQKGKCIKRGGGQEILLKRNRKKNTIGITH